MAGIADHKPQILLPSKVDPGLDMIVRLGRDNVNWIVSQRTRLLGV